VTHLDLLALQRGAFAPILGRVGRDDAHSKEIETLREEARATPNCEAHGHGLVVTIPRFRDINHGAVPETIKREAQMVPSHAGGARPN